jgi:hypothetical protein
VGATLERLMTDGLTRHEAVHAVASVVAEALFKVMKHGVDLDHVAVARSLGRLRSEGWRFA